MKKIFVLIFAITLFFIVSQTKAFASDLNVECRSSAGCTLSGSNPLFSKSLDGIWYPGRILIKTVSVKNTGTKVEQIRLKTTETSGNELKNVMDVNLTKDTGDSIWQGSLADFFGQEIALGNLNPGENKNYSLDVAMETSADNLYQNQQATFNITLGFWEEDSSGSESQVEGASSTGGLESNSGPVLINDSSILGESVRELSSKIKAVFDSGKNPKEVLGNKSILSSCSANIIPYLIGSLITLLLLFILYILIRIIKRFLKRKKNSNNLQ